MSSTSLPATEQHFKSFCESLKPAPLQRLDCGLLQARDIELHIKREDLLHPRFGGNKWHKLRHKRTFTEIAKRAGLQIGQPKYIAWCALLSLPVIGYLVLVPPPLEIFTRDGSPQAAFVGLPLGTGIAMSLFYGVVKTGFCEEFLFRASVGLLKLQQDDLLRAPFGDVLRILKTLPLAASPDAAPQAVMRSIANVDSFSENFA